MDGKEFRLTRISKEGKFFVVPLDHGMTNSNIIDKLMNFSKLISEIDNRATAIVVHKGMVRYLPKVNNLGLIVHLSASTEACCEVRKILVGNVVEAVKVGADAVSIHVNLGNDYEKEMLKDFSKISEECMIYQMPLLVMMYIRDNNNNDISTPQKIKHAIRIASELGADIVKISSIYEGEELDDIISSSLIPVIISGGEFCEDDDALLQRIRNFMLEGASGVAFGRNVFACSNPNERLDKLRSIIIKKKIFNK